MEVLSLESPVAVILSGSCSGAAAAYITHILMKRNENHEKFKNHFCEAVEHVSLANSYWNKGEVQKKNNELEKAANSFLRASVYGTSIDQRLCEILAEILLNLSKGKKD